MSEQHEKWAYYIAFPASKELYQGSLRFLDTYENKPQTEASPILAEVMRDYVPEVLDALLIRPTQLAGIGPTATKIVNISASTISKTANGLIKQILKKTKNSDLKDIHGHIDGMILNPDDTEKGVALSAVRIPDELYHRARALIERTEKEPPSEFHDEVVSLLIEVTDALTFEVMRKPVGLMPLGPVMKKIANGAIDTTISAVMKVVKRVFAKMNDEELRATSRYFDELLVRSKKGA